MCKGVGPTMRSNDQRGMTRPGKKHCTESASHVLCFWRSGIQAGSGCGALLQLRWAVSRCSRLKAEGTWGLGADALHPKSPPVSVSEALWDYANHCRYKERIKKSWPCLPRAYSYKRDTSEQDGRTHSKRQAMGAQGGGSLLGGSVGSAGNVS